MATELCSFSSCQRRVSRKQSLISTHKHKSTAVQCSGTTSSSLRNSSSNSSLFNSHHLTATSLSRPSATDVRRQLSTDSTSHPVTDTRSEMSHSTADQSTGYHTYSVSTSTNADKSKDCEIIKEIDKSRKLPRATINYKTVNSSSNDNSCGDDINDLLDGRSLFSCSSKSSLYFNKVPSNRSAPTSRALHKPSSLNKV